MSAEVAVATVAIMASIATVPPVEAMAQSMTAEPAVAAEPAMPPEPAMPAVVLRSGRDRSSNATGQQRKRGVTSDTGRSEPDVHGTFSSSSIIQGHRSSAGWELAAPILSRPGQS